MVDLLLAWFKIDVGEGAFYSVFGYAFVFLGIALLVGIFTVLGIVMKKMNSRKPRKKKIKTEEFTSDTVSESSGISDETVAAIVAAISALYESENTKCDFVVRRIKRL